MSDFQLQLSASCKAHADLTWTIENTRSVLARDRTPVLQSQYLPFRDFGFGASTLRWSVKLCPDHEYENKKDGDPKFIGVYLCLTDEAGILDQQVDARHRLAACSSAAPKEEQTRRAEIDDVDGETLDQLLKYIYFAEIRDIKKNAEKILATADKYDIGDLRDQAVKHLSESFTTENAYRISTLASMHSLPLLRSAASELMAKTWALLRETPEFLQIKADNPTVYGMLEAACGTKKRKADVL